MISIPWYIGQLKLLTTVVANTSSVELKTFLLLYAKGIGLKILHSTYITGEWFITICMYMTFTFRMVEWPVFQTLNEGLSSNIYFCYMHHAWKAELICPTTLKKSDLSVYPVTHFVNWHVGSPCHYVLFILTPKHDNWNGVYPIINPCIFGYRADTMALIFLDPTGSTSFI